MSANIIKVRASEYTTSATSIKREVHDASLEAQKILEAARSDAERIVSQAESERDTLMEESRSQGYSVGLAQWNETLVEASKLRDEYLNKNESELIRLVVAATRKVIGEEISANPTAIRNTVREVLRSAKHQKRMTIQVNPAQEEIVTAEIANLRTLVGGICELTVLGNSSIEEGGCVVESDIGTIDAQISTQLTALEQTLLQKVSQ
jgi:type III secretion system HrpE/YscL family protein